MTAPQNPNTIVIKNKFYPNGLTEGDIWNYYQKYKSPILKEVAGRYLVVFIMVDVNKEVVRRKTKDGKYVLLNNSNYDNIVTGRTVSFHSTMAIYEDFGIVDIDCDDFNLAKEAAIDVHNKLLRISKDIQIRFTGKTAFHVICGFNRKIKIGVIRDMLRNELQSLTQYTMAQKRTKGIPNLDLAPNKFNGAYITLNSLSIWGLRCIEVDYKNLSSFRPSKALIK